MPSTRKQQRAAGLELRLRQEGKRSQQPKGKDTRPFGGASTETLRAHAKNPIPSKQRVAATKELLRRSAGHQSSNRNAAFVKSSQQRVEWFANATDEQIAERNEKERR